MQDKRIFISGGAGVIGTALVSLLLNLGADLYIGDLKPCPKRWLGKVRYRQGDLNTITDQELLDFNPHIFFHLAATFERSEETYPFLEENYHHNVKLSHHLMGCLKEAPALERVIFASSYLIYDPSLYLFKEEPVSPTVLTEDSSIYPRNICGVAKLFHELELRFLEGFHKGRISFISARIFRVYGRNSRDVISRWVRSALRQETLRVYRPEGMFDYIFADDVAEGLIRLAQSSYSGVVNLGRGEARSIQQVLAILKLYFPSLNIVQEETDIPIEASQANMQRFREITKWMPPHRLEDAISQIVETEREGLQHSSEVPRRGAILVTSISKKVPMLQAVRSAIDKLCGQWGSLIGCDTNPDCIGQYAVDQFWNCAPLDKLQFSDIFEFCRDNRIKGIIPTRNADLSFYSNHLKEFQEEGIQVMVSDPDTVETCLDKKRFAEKLLKERLPAIPTALTIEEIDGTSYVVKERFGAGALQIGLKLTREEAIKHAKTLENPVFQPYIAGIEWSVDLYVSLQGKVMGCVARQRNTVIGGESQITTTAHYPSLEMLCSTVAQRLDIRGHAVLQVIEDTSGQFRIIECNPRFGGASTASIAVGLDSFYWFLLECGGQNVQDYPFNRSQNEIRQIRYPADWIMPWSSSSI